MSRLGFWFFTLTWTKLSPFNLNMHEATWEFFFFFFPPLFQCNQFCSLFWCGPGKFGLGLSIQCQHLKAHYSFENCFFSSLLLRTQIPMQTEEPAVFRSGSHWKGRTRKRIIRSSAQRKKQLYNRTPRGKASLSLSHSRQNGLACTPEHHSVIVAWGRSLITSPPHALIVI